MRITQWNSSKLLKSYLKHFYKNLKIKKIVFFTFYKWLKFYPFAKYIFNVIWYANWFLSSAVSDSIPIQQLCNLYRNKKRIIGEIGLLFSQNCNIHLLHYKFIEMQRYLYTCIIVNLSIITVAGRSINILDFQYYHHNINIKF